MEKREERGEEEEEDLRPVDGKEGQSLAGSFHGGTRRENVGSLHLHMKRIRRIKSRNCTFHRGN